MYLFIERKYFEIVEDEYSVKIYKIWVVFNKIMWNIKC